MMLHMLILAAATGAGPAIAQDAPASGVMQARAQQQFAAADVDKDGRLNQAEVQAMLKARGGRRAAADPDRAAKRMERMARRLDANGDGFVDMAEVNAAMAARMAKRTATEGE